MSEKEKERSAEYKRIDAFMRNYENMNAEEQARLKETMQKSADAFFDADFVVPDNLYMDLDFVRDTKLGTILTFVLEQSDPEKAYALFREGLKEYQLRLYDETTPHFPFLNITEEAFHARRSDPDWADRIFAHSPSTVFHETLKDKIAHNVNHTHASGKFKKHFLKGSTTHYQKEFSSITFHINTWPLELSDDSRKQIGLFFNNMFQVDALVENIDPLTMELSKYKVFEEITTFHFKRFMDNDAIYNHVSNLTFTGMYFFSPLILPKQEISNKEFERQLKLLTNIMSAFYTFQWLHSARFCCDVELYGTRDEIDPTQPLKPLVG